ncbi:hypothetical protein [Kitasatospora sp. LaBMicrA B282]|uniref:hypothetical protein n=1 Tax=Kitasatospora sp. LaBMicrA B282 TaxID=3420949 RepID=UPI003D0AE140
MSSSGTSEAAGVPGEGGAEAVVRARVAGGRRDHRVLRVRLARPGRRPAVRLRTLCGAHHLAERDLERPLCGVPCPACEQVGDPLAARRAVLAREQHRADHHGQDPLPYPLSPSSARP